MDSNPSFGAYVPEDYELVRRTCLHVASVLGTLLDDLTVVGGMVPSLLIPQNIQEAGQERHPGTMDLDLGMSLAVLDEMRYAAIATQLRSAGFAPDRNERGNTVLQRWCAPSGGSKVTVDFLIPKTEEASRPGTMFWLEPDFGAIVTPGLQLVGRDWRPITLDGHILDGSRACRVIRVCGPGAFVVLKARAVRQREKDKNAYDLDYLLRYYGRSIEDVAAALRPLLDDRDAQEAVEWLRSDFTQIDSIGPMRAARFRYGGPDDEFQADVHGLMQQLLQLVG